MKTILINLYEYDELSEEARERAIEKLCDINIDHEWWDYVYDDAENIGLKITGFDIDRRSYCEGDFIEYPEEVARLIIENHGESCETYKTAKAFLGAIKDIDLDEDDMPEEEINEFKRSLLEDYRIMLQHEYEYKTSTEAIEETIRINEYQFTEDGSIF